MPCDVSITTAALFALAVVTLASAIAGLRRVWPRVQDGLRRLAEEMTDHE